jgi:predicted KAP-like P-loop ATPase
VRYVPLVNVDGTTEIPTRREGQAPFAVSPDEPLSDPNDDKLGYAPFAKAVADGIAEMDVQHGLVVAIYGAWGLGKTTAINFIEHFLESSSTPRPQDVGAWWRRSSSWIARRIPLIRKKGTRDELLVVHFNPWWFSGRLELATAFFEQLLAVFDKHLGLKRVAKKRMMQLAQVAGAVVGRGNDVASLRTGSVATVPDLKRDLSDQVVKRVKRLVIVMDDIDRLVNDEIAHVFGVIKALADFPNTVYLLAFDRHQVEQALDGQTGDSGSRYLEKIVQVEFDLPLPDREMLQDLLLERLDAIVGLEDFSETERDQLHSLVRKGLAPLLRTPRDVIRFANSLHVTYRAVRSEVDVRDFVGIEALRLFEPNLYESVRSRPELFGVVSLADRVFPQEREKAAQAYHSSWPAQIADPVRRDGLKEIVGRLFPSTVQALHVSPSEYRREDESRRRHAISTDTYFPTYFRFALAGEGVSREAILDLVHSAANPKDFGRRLVELAGRTMSSGRTEASVMLDELEAQAEYFEPKDIPGAIDALLDIGDELWIDSDHNFPGLENPSRICWLIGALLQRTPAEERCDLIQRSIQEAGSVTVPAVLVRRLTKGLGVPDGVSVQAVDRSQLDETMALISVECARKLELAAAEKIAGIASEHLWDRPRPIWLLHEWSRWGEPGKASAWIRAMLKDGRQVVGLLLDDRPATIDHIPFNPESFDGLVGREEVAEAVREVQGATRDESLKEACEKFLLASSSLDAGETDPRRPPRRREG